MPVHRPQVPEGRQRSGEILQNLLADPAQYLRDGEHDACALIGVVRKDGIPHHDNVAGTVEALVKMIHRSGDVDGEGDGCGLLTDIPRRLWRSRLKKAGLQSALADEPGFAVAHIAIPRAEHTRAAKIKAEIIRRIQFEGLEVLLEQDAEVDHGALGPRAAADEATVWQVALLGKGNTTGEIDRRLYYLTIAIEEDAPVHVASLSRHTVVYKVRGTAEVLRSYYADLHNPEYESVVSIGHNRYSTNTSTIFERVQPFSLLGHNGEINTIRKLREEAQAAGITLVRGGSDSQDVNRAVEGLVHQYGLTLLEAMELVFPPIVNEIKQIRPELQDLYMHLRQTWGPFTQGPVAMCVRHANECLFLVDALGLRPLWQVETDDSLWFSSEQGVVPATAMVQDPKPLAPGEKVAVLLAPGHAVEVLSYPQIQNRVLKLSHQRGLMPTDTRRFIDVGGPKGDPIGPDEHVRLALVPPPDALLAAHGWGGEDLQLVRLMAGNGNEPIGSLGYDGPLAALNPERQNLADFFKESVAVVTNPAIDREREIEHFSTRVIIGARPPIGQPEIPDKPRVEIRLPLLLGGHRGESPLTRGAYRDLARSQGIWLLEDVLALFREREGEESVFTLDAAYSPSEGLKQALDRLAQAAAAAVRDGAQIVLIDDRRTFHDEMLWIDPHLVLSHVDLTLKRADVRGGVNLRRRCSLLLRSGALRNLHDVAMAVGLGADAVNPYLMLEAVAGDDPSASLANITTSLQKGLEKVISTLGVHEIRGYARLFASIGLKPGLSRYFDCGNYCGSEDAGLGLLRLKADSAERYHIAVGAEHAELARAIHFWPRLWKACYDAANGRGTWENYRKLLDQYEVDRPVSLRHLMDFRWSKAPVDPAAVDTGIGGHSFPISISGMSFGSQGETAFRAYPEAAKRLNIVAMNGEGGEIPDMVGRYRKWRGQQIASGRFGVHVDMLTGSAFLEIKIGQGAKPGEGGHLPGSKVSAKVASARNATQGIDLISPSNNHDLYSIEDLAQIVEELKTINPEARVVVKVPVVPNIGTIAVGIAKSGADVIALCGYDGGTGAARKHALRHAGLPVELGVREAHLALIEAGIRDRVEVWGDGGIRSGADVMKLILLGANRVGFGTYAMVAIGCTICRGCQLDTCHVGIATQMETLEEAHKKGLKVFNPREYETAVGHLVQAFSQIGAEVREITARLGATTTQELVGRADLLYQARHLERLDLTELVQPVVWARSAVAAGVRQVANPRTRAIARVATARLDAGEDLVEYEDAPVTAADRILGTYLAGEVARGRSEQRWNGRGGVVTHLKFGQGSVTGNGLAAWGGTGVEITVHGGAQDGVGKGMLGGKVIVLKGSNHYGGWVNGCVGKSAFYGAQRGLFIVQGDADARCGIRLSGADVIIGGELRGPLDDSLGCLGARANIKGFGFEYMTNGRAIVLGDPGPWFCSGMTGGVVYQRLQPELGLTEAAIKRRLAKGAKVFLAKVGARGKKDLHELLGFYHQALLDAGQGEQAARILDLLLECEKHFISILPVSQQADPTISTE